MAGEFVAGSVISHLILDTTKWDYSVKKVSGDIAGQAAKWGKMGKAMTMKVTLPILAIGAAAVKAAADLDQSMTESLAIMGDVSDELRGSMEDTAKQLAGESTFAAKELAEGYYFLASAGMSAEKSIAALPKVTKFAQAGAFDLALATDLLTDAQSALALTSEDAEDNMIGLVRVSDALVGANTLANATVQEFSEALTNRAGPAMKNINMEIEEGVAVLAAFADQGVKGRKAGMQFAIVLQNMETAARRNKDEWAALNVSLYDSDDNLRNMADVVADLENALGHLPPKQKAAALAQLGFNDKAAAAIKMLLGTSEKIRTYQTDLENLGGITEEVAAKQMEAFSNQLKALKNDLVVVGAEFGEQLIPVLKDLMEDYLKPAIKWFKNLSDGQKKLIVQLGFTVAALGPILSIFSKLVIVSAKLKGMKGLGGLKTSVSGLTFLPLLLLPLLAGRSGKQLAK